MRERGVVRPVLERRPAARVVRADRVAVREHVLADRTGAGGLVVGTVDERARDAVRMPRAPAVDAAAEELEGHHVHVGVEQAAHLAERRGAAGGLAADVGLGFGIDGAAVGRLEREARGHVAEDEPAVLHAEPPVAQAQHVAVLDRPVGGLARRGLALDALGRDRKRTASVAEEVAPGAVEQVAAERRGLQPEALALRAEPVAAVGGLGDLGAAVGQDVAAAGQGKAVCACASARAAFAAAAEPCAGATNITAISTPSATRTSAKVPASGR